MVSPLFCYIFCFYEQIGYLDGNRQVAQLCGAEHTVQHILAAGFFQLDYGDAGDLIEGEYLFQLRGNIKIRSGTAKQRHLAFG